jgi:hypothetical protein
MKSKRKNGKETWRLPLRSFISGSSPNISHMMVAWQYLHRRYEYYTPQRLATIKRWAREAVATRTKEAK